MCFHSHRTLASWLIASAILVLAACQREKRDLRPQPTRVAIFGDAARQSDLQPGGVQSQPAVTNPDSGNAYAISEGQRLYSWYNCSGCHANGGGGIGPPLMDNNWIYGSEPANVFATIMQGRPNGMPSFRGRIPEEQAWQIVAYVRSMSGLVSSDGAPNRSDTLLGAPPESLRDPARPGEKRP